MQKTSQSDILKVTRSPQSMHDIHSFYTRSKTSIFNALPSPPIQTTLHHTYVTLTSVIDYFLAYVHTPEYITANDNMNTKKGIAACEQANKIRHEASEKLQ